MPDRKIEMLPADHAARPTVRVALWLSAVLAVAFVAFGYVTTQDKAVRAGSPWQNDPYDGVISFTLFLVPAVILLMLVRMSLRRGGEPQPLFRIDQLLRASVMGTVLVAATMVTDWLAVAVRADREVWDHHTPWLVASLVPLSVLTLLSAWLQVRAFRKLPSRGDQRSDGDWLDDLKALMDRVAPRLPAALRSGEGGAIGFVRGHIVAFAALLSVVSSLGYTTIVVVSESWTNPLLMATVVGVSFGVFFAFCLLSNAVLHIAVPRDGSGRRPAPMGRRQRAAYRALIAGLIAMPTAAFMRDSIWSLLMGHRDEVSTAGQWAGLVAVSGLVVGFATFFIALAASKPQADAPERPSR
ncbi:MAG: hypothetical protein JWN52_5498 [Actinomycetia bacterium]|nr:hypothetical protein [Actinomycetes bacterium]